jgi:hypothetical protein
MTTTSAQPIRSGRRRLITAVVLLSLLIGLGWGLWKTVAELAPVQLQVRTPQDVPSWLVAGHSAPHIFVDELGDDAVRYVEQTWCTSPYFENLPERVRRELNRNSGQVPLFFTCVKLYAMAGSLDIAQAGKTSIIVDGVRGWLWKLGPTDMGFPETIYGSLSEEETHRVVFPPVEVFHGALTTSSTREEFFQEAWIYLAAYSARLEGIPIMRGQFSTCLKNVLAGDAVALQWNRNGMHYLLIGQEEGRITQDILIRMANSMAPVQPYVPG